MPFKKLSGFKIIMVFALLAFTVQLLPACNNATAVVNPGNNSTKLVIVNASPDEGPVTAYINNLQLGNTSTYLTTRTYFTYATTPVYYGIGTGDLVFQLRDNNNNNLVTDSVTTASNTGYTLFLVGLASVDSLSNIIVADTSAVPALGRGKVRFINASPRTSALDIYANGTLAFTKMTYKKVSNYIELPAGIYDFKMTATGAPSSVLVDLPRTTVQDGKYYTLYTKGMVGRTDSAAITLNVITNR